MLDKISFFGKIEKSKEIKPPPKNKLPDIPKDEFTRNSKMQNETKYTKDEIISILGSFSFEFLAKDLMKEGRYSNGYDSIAFLEDNTKGKYVGMAIENFKTLNTERHNFSFSEFKEMLNGILSKSINKTPEKTDEYTTLHTKLIKKIEAEFE